MSRLERNWQYAEQFPTESDTQVRARRLSLEMGIEPISRGVAAQISGLVPATKAESICEVGTGVGLSGLSLLRYAPHATLTSIEIEGEYLREARTLFSEAGIPAPNLRLIQGDALQVLPRLNHSAYDVVLIDADHSKIFDFFEIALQIVRPGGTLLIPNAFVHDKVTDPAARDAHTQNMRDLLATVNDSALFAPVLSPVGNGLLMLTRLHQTPPAHS